MRFKHKIIWSSVMMAISASTFANLSNTYDASTGLLTLPVVNIPSGNGSFQRYSAILEQLPPDSAYPNSMVFRLKDAQNIETSPLPRETAYFTPSVGKVAFPLSVLGAGFYWIEMAAKITGLDTKFVLDLNTGILPAQSNKILTLSKSGDQAGNIKVSGGAIDCGSDSCWTKLTTTPVTLTTAVTDTTKTSVKWTGCDSISTPTAPAAPTCTVTPTAYGIRNVEVEMKDKIPSFCFGTDGTTPLSSGFKSSPLSTVPLDFGNVQVGTPALSNFMISAPSVGDDLCIQSMGLSGSNADDFRIVDPVFPPYPEFIKLPKNSAKPLFIECTPGATSLRTAVLNLQTNDPTQPIVKYNLRCTGVNEPQPNYYSDPFPGAEIDFGGSARNQETSPNTKILINNRGLMPLEIYKLKVSGANANDFLWKGATSLTIQPNEPAKAFEMSCKPSDLGFRVGALELGSNDPTRQTITYPLKCQGTEKCVLNFPPEGDINSDIIAPPGGGFAAKYDRIKPESCLNGKVTEIGHTEFYLDGEIVDSLEEVANSLGISGSLGLNFKVFKMKVAASYLRSAKATDRSTTFVYKFQVKFPNRRFEINQNDPLSAMGKKLINSPSCWENACGSNYVSQTAQSTDLYAFVQLNFSSKESKTAFEANLSASYRKIATLQLAMKQMSSDLKSSGSITIKAIQRGGDATKLPNIFNADADTVDASIKCGLAQTTSTGAPGGAKDYTECEKVMNNILVYAKGDFLNGAVIEKSQTTGYLFSRYDELSIGSPNVDFEPSPEVITARQTLANAYNRELDNFNLVKDLSSEPLDNDSKNKTTQLLSKIDYNIEILRSMAAWCFSDLNRCVDKQKQATAFENEIITLSDGKTTIKGMLKIYDYMLGTPILGVSGVTYGKTDGRYTFKVKDVHGVEKTIYLNKQ